MDGSLVETLQQKVGRELRCLAGLPREEAVVVALLTRRLSVEGRARGPRSAAEKTARVERRAARPARVRVAA
jgi:hypothetical protein